jgi:hypothetical protein
LIAPRLLFGPDGSFAVAWDSSRADCETCVSLFQILIRVYSPRAELIAEKVLEGPEVDTVDPPILTGAGSEAFSLIWTEVGTQENPVNVVRDRRFSWKSGEVLGETPLLQSTAPTFFSANCAARAPGGGLLVAGPGVDSTEPPCNGCDLGGYAQIFGVGGAPVTPLFQLEADPLGYQIPTAVATDSEGRFLVSWWSEIGGRGQPEDAFVRRYAPTGEPLGPEIRANTFTAGSQANGGVAADAAGEFVVVWDSYLQDGSFGGVYGQRFTPDGDKIGPEFRANTITASDQYNSRVAMDREGNFVVVWQTFDAVGFDMWDIKGQLFRKDGTPVGREFFVNSNIPYDQEFPFVAFADNGTFGAVWTSFAQGTGVLSDDAYFQRFSASPGDEPCWVRCGKVFCDTGRTGGAAEIAMTFGGRPGETLLAGDFDGDGRADLCAHYGIRFRCDLDHRGAPAEVAMSFGLPGDVPLMGDLDGDGRADFCVRRKRQLLCDTAHDGGKPELRILFGLATDLPLLGDVDGDGRSDPCLWRAGHFLCDTAHDGGGAEVDVAFGQPGDLPALGDVDGDGRADFCVLRAGHLLCDTAHDGGAAEFDLALDTLPGDLPLIANFDAL